MDEKTQFLLKLKGKHDGGHLHHWSEVDGEIAGLLGESDNYTLAARSWGYEMHDDYLVGRHDYFTLGKKCPHTELVEILQRKAPREKLLLAYRNETIEDGS